MRIAVNSWPLVENPEGPAAFMLRERVEALRRASGEVEIVALAPAEQPRPDIGFDGWLTNRTDLNTRGRLWFEQRYLPRMAAEAQAHLLLTQGRAAPLRSEVPVALEVLPEATRGRDGIWDRLRRAMGAAGAAGVSLRYAWSDSGELDKRLEPVTTLKPFVAPSFRVTERGEDSTIRRELKLPPAYVLCHGVEGDSVDFLLAAWTWVDASVGDQIPLVLAGLNDRSMDGAAKEIRRLDLEGSVQLLDTVEWDQLPALYRGAEAFLHTGLGGSSQVFRWAMATGIPVAAMEIRSLSPILGEAGYLTPLGDSRALGAACLTLLVEPKTMAEPLRQKGLMRAGSYHGEAPVQDWWNALRSVVKTSE